MWDASKSEWMTGETGKRLFSQMNDEVNFFSKYTAIYENA